MEKQLKSSYHEAWWSKLREGGGGVVGGLLKAHSFGINPG